MYKKNIQKNKGMSLVESLVAIGILSLSILATFTAVQGSLQASIEVKDRITAYQLAQEGMEIIRNIRDNNGLNSINGGSNTWVTGLANTNFSPAGICYGVNCTVDSTTVPITVTECSGTCPYLKRDPVSGLMGYNAGWTLTNFRRDINFVTLYPPDEVVVRITITWTTRGATRTFQVSEILYNKQ